MLQQSSRGCAAGVKLEADAGGEVGKGVGDEVGEVRVELMAHYSSVHGG